MTEFTISRDERELLRESAKVWGGVFDDLGQMVEGAMKLDPELVLLAELAFAGLAAIGWQNESDREEYALPATPVLLEFVRQCREDSASLERPDTEAVDVFDSILGRAPEAVA